MEPTTVPKARIVVRSSDGSGEKVKSRVSVVRKVRLREHQAEEGVGDMLGTLPWLMLLGYWARGYRIFFSCSCRFILHPSSLYF